MCGVGGRERLAGRRGWEGGEERWRRCAEGGEERGERQREWEWDSEGFGEMRGGSGKVPSGVWGMGAAGEIGDWRWGLEEMWEMGELGVGWGRKERENETKE
ncbi:MAG: hypothetical protein ACKESB_01610 [Candidatus Hodgkinia cicadicola]